MLRRHLTLILLSAAFAVLFLFPAFSTLLTDWWWFGEIGYRIVFTRELTTRVLLFLAAGLVIHHLAGEQDIARLVGRRAGGGLQRQLVSLVRAIALGEQLRRRQRNIGGPVGDVAVCHGVFFIAPPRLPPRSPG